MKKNFKLLSLLILWYFFIGGCKYPDGPMISLKTKMNRLRGDWNLEHMYMNGVDYASSVRCDSCDYFIEFTELNGQKVFNANYVVQNELQYVEGWFNFNDHKKHLQHSATMGYDSTGSPIMLSYYPLYTKDGEIDDWRILRLADGEVWLETFDGSTKYEMQLKLIRKLY